MKIVLTVLMAAGLIVTSGGRAQAQARLASLEAPAAARGDSTALSARVREAVATFHAGRMDQARRELDAAARAQEAAGVLPDTALWLLAEAELASGENVRAAATLDRLARLAELHGDPVMQARALFEAAVQYQQARLGDRARERYERMRPLLGSPYMPVKLSESLQARVVHVR